jgi:hypothetical protein
MFSPTAALSSTVQGVSIIGEAMIVQGIILLRWEQW